MQENRNNIFWNLQILNFITFYIASATRLNAMLKAFIIQLECVSLRLEVGKCVIIHSKKILLPRKSFLKDSSKCRGFRLLSKLSSDVTSDTQSSYGRFCMFITLQEIYSRYIFIETPFIFLVYPNKYKKTKTEKVQPHHHHQQQYYIR